MENILLIVVIVILVLTYRSFKDYFANPNSHGSLRTQQNSDHESFEDPYSQVNERTKIERSEFGIIAALMAKIARADGVISPLEVELVENMLDDLSREFIDTKEARKILGEIFVREQASDENIELLALDFARLTKGEYKKRLKIIEFLLTIAYADGNLAQSERESIIDIAAYLELDNADFNKIYDDFEGFFSKKGDKLSKQEALKIFELREEEATQARVKSRYRELVKLHHPDILQGKGMDKQMIDGATKKLQEINSAYEVLKDGR